jgi:hypothetical protein
MIDLYSGTYIIVDLVPEDHRVFGQFLISQSSNPTLYSLRFYGARDKETGDKERTVQLHIKWENYLDDGMHSE